MSLIQQALKRQQDEAKGKVTLPPPHLGSTQLAVKPEPTAPPKPGLNAPTPNITPVERTEGDIRPKFIHHPEPTPPAPPPAAERPLAPPLVAPPVLQQTPPAAPPPPHAAVYPTAPEPAKKSGSNLILILLVLLLIGYGGWKYWRKAERAADTVNAVTQTVGEALANGTKTTAPPNEGQPVVKHIGPLPDVKDIKSKVAAMQAAVSNAQSQHAEIDAAEEPAKPKPTPPPTSVAETKPTPPAPMPVSVVAPAPQPAPVATPAVWPTVTINGVMPNATASKSSAILNGNLIAVGESLDGVTLIEVRDRGVTLEYKGEQKFVLIGRR